MAARRGIALALALCLAAPPALADAPLKRLTLRQDLLGWEAVGRVEFGQGGYCTGVLIAPDLVLTAAHCLFRDGPGLVAPETLRFRAGLSDGRALAQSGVLRTAVHPGYAPQGGDAGRRIRHDIGLMQLATPVPVTTAAPFPVAALAPGAHDLSVVSYGQGRDAAPSWDEGCRVVDRAEGLIAFDCDVTFGSSGAPVFHRGAGRAALVALVSSGAESGGRRLGLGMELPAAVAELKAALRRGGGSPAVTGPRAGGTTTGGGLAGAGGAGGAKFVRP